MCLVARLHQTRWGASALPDPLATMRGPTSKGQGRKRRKERKKKRR